MITGRIAAALGCSVLAAVASCAEGQGEDVPPELVSARVAEAPTLDGGSGPTPCNRREIRKYTRHEPDRRAMITPAPSQREGE